MTYFPHRPGQPSAKLLGIEKNFGCIDCGGPLMKCEGPVWVCILCDRNHDKPHEEGAHKKPKPRPSRFKRLTDWLVGMAHR